MKVKQPSQAYKPPTSSTSYIFTRQKLHRRAILIYTHTNFDSSHTYTYYIFPPPLGQRVEFGREEYTNRKERDRLRRVGPSRANTTEIPRSVECIYTHAHKNDITARQAAGAAGSAHI